MQVLLSDERRVVVDGIMQRRFGVLMKWERPTLLHTFGPNDLAVIDDFEAELDVAKKLTLESLAQIPMASLALVSTEHGALRRLETSAWEAHGAQAVQKLHRTVPPEIAFGFGHPCFRADFDHWGKMPRLRLHEALLLSVGADPSSLKDEELSKLERSRENGQKLWTAHDFLLKRRDLLRRHFRNSGFGYFEETPAQLKAWIDEIGLSVHPGFYSELEKRTAVLKQPEPMPDGRPIANQERTTLLKLIAAMACEQYQYDPKDERSGATRHIRDDIESVGLSMDDKTTRKWLKEAAELVAPDYWPKG